MALFKAGDVVECIKAGNMGLPNLVKAGKLYEVAWAGTTAGVQLKDQTYIWASYRFKLVAVDKANVESTNNPFEWKVWRDQGLQTGECVCRMPRELCDFHR